LELLPPNFLGAISEGSGWGNHETDRHFGADGRHVHRLDGERNLALNFGGSAWQAALAAQNAAMEALQIGKMRAT
jgi:hypothetical protein